MAALQEEYREIEDVVEFLLNDTLQNTCTLEGKIFYYFNI